MHTILIVDDDQDLRRFIAIQLREEGFQVVEAENGEKALTILEEQLCDLAIVDIMMPGIDGYELTQSLRSFTDFPIILLTAKGQIESKEKGFLAGADDYLVKPFEIRELIFRMRALLRRYQKNTEDVISFPSTTIDRRNYEVTVGEQSFLIPLKEFELLFHLAAHPGQAFTREQLVEKIWGFAYEGDERTVDVHIKRLRDRFSNQTNDFAIRTIRGIGYMLEEQT